MQFPSWNSIKKILKEAYHTAFTSAPFRIVGKNTDELTQHAIFLIKAKKIPMPISLATYEIMHNDHYLLGLSLHDRKEIATQYLYEIKQPLAYIEEYPVAANENDEYIFKIFLVNEKKMVCRSASDFIKKDKKTLSMLNTEDIVKIAIAHALEQFSPKQDTNSVKKTDNIHYLNLK